MTRSKIFAIAAATILVFTLGAFSTSNTNAQQIAPQTSTPGYLVINTALVQTSGLNALLRTNANIPTDGSGGAFGYGILTTAGTFAVIVATTHQGVKDSVTQGSDSGPIWHNHFASLAFGGPDCGSNPHVATITFQQPGRLLVSGSQALLQGIPSTFTGTNALPPHQQLTLTPGHNVQNVVSFVLVPKGGSICVEDITPAQHIIKD